MRLFEDLPDSVRVVLNHEFHLVGPVDLALRRKKNNNDPQWPEIEARLSELLAMPSGARTELASKIVRKIATGEKNRQLFEESNRFFNLRTSAAKVERWGRMPVWTLAEALSLSFDKEPTVVNLETVEPYIKISTFAQEYMERWDMILRAVSVGELTSPVKRDDFLSWLREYGYPKPQKLSDFIERIKNMGKSPQPASEQVHTNAAAQALQTPITPIPIVVPSVGDTADEASDLGDEKYPWVATARAIAEELLPKHRHLSLEQIAKKVRQEMETRKKADSGESTKCYTGRGDRIPAADTIKRHALKGLKE